MTCLNVLIEVFDPPRYPAGKQIFGTASVMILASFVRITTHRRNVKFTDQLEMRSKHISAD